MSTAVRPKRRVAWGIKRQRGEKNGYETKFENEVLIPRLASGAILWYRFEGVKFDLVENASRITYEPDYLVQLDSGELVAYDVKGTTKINGVPRPFIPEKNRMKCKLFADQYPIRLIAAFHVKPTGWAYEEF